MLAWLAEWGAFAAVFGVIFVPGLAFGWALGMRRLALWAFAPVASTAMLAVLAIAYGLLGVQWATLSVAIGVLIVIGLAALLHLFVPKVDPGGEAIPRGGARWIVPVGLAIGIAVGALRIGFYIGSPENVSQTNDAVFHLNSLRWILDTGSASSLDISGMLGAASFYPAAWHAPASLAAMISGAALPVVANMQSIVIGAIVWPLAIAWFTSAITRRSVVPTALAAALSSALLAFPLLLMQWGLLYPYQLGIALLPAALAPLLIALRPEALGRGWRSMTMPVFVVLIGIAAVALSQPSLVLIWGIAAACAITWAILLAWREMGSRARVITAIGWSIGALVFAAIWILLTRQVTGGVWPSSRGKLQAGLDILLNGQVGYPVAVGASILMVIGIVVAIRQPRLRWLATFWVVLSGMYFVAVAVGNIIFRVPLLGAFYSDPYRIAALAPLAVIPLAAIGGAAVVRWAAGAVAKSRPRAERAERQGIAIALGTIATVSVVGLILVPVVQWRDVFLRTVDAHTLYSISDSTYLSTDELALLERLDETVPMDALIVGNPSTGMAFGYALGEREVYPRTWSPPRTTAYRLLGQSLGDAATDPAVCEAVTALGVDHVLDFGAGATGAGRWDLPGFTGLDDREGFELVDSEGDAKLFRITACG